MNGRKLFIADTDITELSDIAKVEKSIFSDFIDNLKLNSLDFLVRILIAAIVLIIGTYVIKYLRKWFSKLLERSSIDKGNAQLLENAVKIGLYFILVLFVAAHFGIEATSVLAILGSAGLTVGLAFQGALSNFAGGVLIIAAKPFRLGDYIEIESSFAGTVTEIGIVHTKLLTIDHRVVIIPNGKLANSTITNYTNKPRRRIELIVGVDYETDIDRARSVLEEVIEREPLLIKDDEVLIYVDALSSSSIDMGIRVYTRTENYWTAKWSFTESIKKAFDANGIKIPFNQMDVHISQTD